MSVETRYARQLRLPEIGPAGQSRIENAAVLIVGLGGLGSPVALYLAAAGVGRLGLIDDDRVELSNLQRQVLFEAADQGLEKVTAARKRLEAFNPELRIECYPERLSAKNAESTLGGYDLIVDGTDNFATKYLINDVAARLEKPWIYGSILGFEGRASLFCKNLGPCYRCLYPEAPRVAVPNCAEAGVLGALAGIVGSVQALEALKWIASFTPGSPGPKLDSLLGKLWTLDGLSMETRTLEIDRRSECPICGRPAAEITILAEESEELEAEELTSLLNSVLLVDVREPHEFALGHIPGALNLPVSLLSQVEVESPDLPGALFAGPPVVVYCHVGVRSEWALQFLKARGVRGARHLRGGIMSWAGPLRSD